MMILQCLKTVIEMLVKIVVPAPEKIDTFRTQMNGYHYDDRWDIFEIKKRKYCPVYKARYTHDLLRIYLFT